MIAKVLDKSRLEEWITDLLAERTVIAPTRDERGFAPIAAADDACLDYGNTRRPPKEFLLPPTQTLLEFGRQEDGITISATLPEGSPQVLLGVRPCDAAAIGMLDAVYLGSEPADPYYRARRENTVIVTLACREPLAGCFCTSLDIALESPEGDVALYDLGDRYYAEARTPAGEALLAGSLWREPNDADRAAQAEAAGQVRRELAPTVNREALAAKLRALGESPLWEELARACVSCGTCTFLCPTCYCFDMQDEGFAGEGRRFRCWDTCQNPAFTLMTSGENPRRRRGTRVHQRIGHKFQYMVERLDRTYCVGCGRCVRLCPVGIDLREVLQEVQGAEPISA